MRFMTRKTLGKPVGQDDLHGRPNAVTELGSYTARLTDERHPKWCDCVDPKMPGRGDVGQDGERAGRSVDADEMARSQASKIPGE